MLCLNCFLFLAQKNIQPQPRHARKFATDKETVEKSRLKQRTGGFTKYVDPAGLIGSADPSSAGYMPPSDQFVTDVAAEAKLHRQADAAKRANGLLRRREAVAARDEARWEGMEAAKEAEEQRVARLRENAKAAAANRRSMAYDPLTLKYEDSQAGRALKRQDDQIMYRAALRAQRLQHKGNGAEFNLVNGANQVPLHNPMMPHVDPELQKRFNETGVINAYLAPEPDAQQ